MAEINLGGGGGGGFFGGLGSGISEARVQGLAQQKQDALEANEVKAAAAKQIDSTIQHISEVAKAAAANGNDPRAIYAAVQPLISSAQSLAEKAGYDPARVAQMAQLVTMRSPAEDAAVKPVSVKPGDSLVHPTTGKVLYQAPPLDPVTGKPVAGQPDLAPTDVIAPSQIQNANPPPMSSAPPVAPPSIAPSPTAAPIAAAPDGTPAQTVAARFPSPDQGSQPAPATPTGPVLPPGMQPSQQAVDYAINNNVVGPEFLKALPPVDRNTVSDVASYKRPLASVSKRQDKQSTVGSWVHQYTNGEYDQKYYAPMQAALKEFTSGGQTSPAGQITVGNTAIAHGAQVADAIDKLKAVPGLLQKMESSNTPFVSYAAAQLKNQSIRGTSEGQALSAFLTATHHFVDETTKFYAGGQPAEAGRERGLSNFDGAKSEPELYQALNSEAELLHGKVNALQDRWKNAMAGPKMGDLLIRNAIPDFPVLSESSRAALDRIGQGYLASKYKGQAPGAAPGGVVDFKTYFGGQ